MDIVYFPKEDKFGIYLYTLFPDTPDKLYYFQDKNYINCKWQMPEHVREHAMMSASQCLKMWDRLMKEDKYSDEPLTYTVVARETLVQHIRKHQPWKFWIK